MSIIDYFNTVQWWHYNNVTRVYTYMHAHMDCVYVRGGGGVII